MQNKVGGLQIRVDGIWEDVPTIPEGIVVKIGQLLEMLTRGQLPATEHRVLTSKTKRYSAAFFLGDTLDQVVKPMIEVNK